MDQKTENLINVLYEICSDRTLTSEQVFNKLVDKIGLVGTTHIKDKAIEVIRPYKQSMKNLEETVKTLYTLFYNEVDSSINWNPPTEW